MAATTITRTTWTDDSGTPASPAGDGTTIDNSELQLIYDAIDELFSGAGSYTTFTLGGAFQVEGYAGHRFAGTGAGSGAHTLNFDAPTAGTGNLGRIRHNNDNGANSSWDSYTSTYTETSVAKQDGAALRTHRAGGLSIAAEQGSSDIRFFARGTTKMATFDGDRLTFSAGTPGTYALNGVLASSIALSSVGTDANTSEKDLQTYSLPANTLSVNNQAVRIHAAFTTAANGESKRARIYFGSTAVVDSQSRAFNNQDMYQMATVFRTGAASQRSIGFGDTAGTAARLVPEYATPAETLSGAVTIKATGQNGTGTANNIVCTMFWVELIG